MQPWQFLWVTVAGWMNRQQQQVIDYLLEENPVLRFSEPQKRRLAAQAKSVGFRRLKEPARAATPQTLLQWYRTLIGQKHAGTGSRGHG